MPTLRVADSPKHGEGGEGRIGSCVAAAEARIKFLQSESQIVEDISSEILLQLSIDELGEVLEELTGLELNDTQVAGMRELISIAGSLDAALAVLDDFGPSAEAA